jgi:SAM-dependent methyltransferase
MDRAAYEIEAKVQESHWWFVGRRRMFARELRRAGVIPAARILDAGTGTGSNLRLLRELGFQRVVGLDNSEAALAFNALKGERQVCLGSVCDLPFPESSFDLVMATDIVEHVDDDARALAEIARVLRPGGQILLTVPAFLSLWGLQDRLAQHKRRYRMAEVLERLAAAGLAPGRHFYFNYLLFGPIWLARRAIDGFGIPLESENQVNSPAINGICSAIFRLDTLTAPLLHPPFGVSIFVLAERTAALAAPAPSGH